LQKYKKFEDTRKKRNFFSIFFWKIHFDVFTFVPGRKLGRIVLGKIPCSPAKFLSPRKKTPSKGRALFISSRGFDVAYA
jgi:hypothetical protein